MRQTILVLITVLLAATSSEAQPKRDALAMELQAAVQKEAVQGDLKGAIRMYERILGRAGARRDIAAQALLHLGQCHERLGSSDARRAYERLLREFGDHPSAAEARTRLAALGGPAATRDRELYRSPDGLGTPRPNRDGRLVAGLCRRGICMLETATGVTRTVLEAPPSPASYWRPFVSPDGRAVAYTYFANEKGEEKGDLRVIRLGETEATTLLTGSSIEKDYYSAVDWTADGKWILVAHTNRGGAGLWLAPAAGGEPRKLASPEFDWNSGRDAAKISPDGKWVAYPVSKRELQGGGRIPTDVRVAPLTGGEAKTVFAGPGHEQVIGWLENGHLLASSDRSGKNLPYLIRMSGGETQGEPELVDDSIGDADVVGVSMTSGQLFLWNEIRKAELFAFRGSDDPMRKLPLGYDGTSPSFSPDGMHLAYVTGGAHNANSIVLRHWASGEERKLPGGVPLIQQIKWYPDNRHILAICSTGNWGRRPMFRFDTRSGEVKPLPDLVGMTAYFWPAILNDGKTLLYAGAEPGQTYRRGAIIAMDLETGTARTLLRSNGGPDTGIGAFSVSPDRTRIAYGQYTMGDKSARKIFVADLARPDQATTILDCPAGKCDPAMPIFSADQRSILFWQGLPPSSIWTIPVGGGEPKLLRNLPWTPHGPAIHPTSGEMVVGIGKYETQLRTKTVPAWTKAIR